MAFQYQQPSQSRAYAPVATPSQIWVVVYYAVKTGDANQPVKRIFVKGQYVSPAAIKALRQVCDETWDDSFVLGQSAQYAMATLAACQGLY